MDNKSKEYLDAILAKEPTILNKKEKDFLRARVSYLKESQKEEYAQALKPKNQTSKKETVNKDGKESK